VSVVPEEAERCPDDREAERREEVLLLEEGDDAVDRERERRCAAGQCIKAICDGDGAENRKMPTATGM
jgi:hypothetical protein